MTTRTTLSILIGSAVLASATTIALLTSVAEAAPGGTIHGVSGGLSWDKWWLESGAAEPTGEHPLYPPAGSKTGSTTWRCKECHGWDYKGVDGVYGDPGGSHFTGIPGVYGSSMTAEEMFDIIKLGPTEVTNGHDLGTYGMTDDDIDDVVEFLQYYVVDTDTYIDGTDLFTGDEANGRVSYKMAGGYYTCLSCHGEDGAAINFGTVGDPEGLKELALGNPWEVLHKIRFGQPGTTMPSFLLGGGDTQGAADIGKYLQLDFPLPGYVGANVCGSTCHANWPEPYADFKNSGHPWKIYQTGGAVPDPSPWPHTPAPPLPVVDGVQLEWPDVEYTIGNYFWKTRFIRPDGFIYTGLSTDTTQWNIATNEFVPYHAGETDKPFDCGRCHTTGYDPAGNQNGLPGLIGTWAEDGVQCEACHGPAGDHVNISLSIHPSGGKDCDDCHYRDNDFRMPWKGGFMRHHQQGEDLSHSTHRFHLDCQSCHNPHRSTVYDDGGMIAECTDCHAGNETNGFYLVDGMESIECKECHMPYMAKSAVASNTYTGDVRGHLFGIMTDPIAAADNVYADGSNLFWNQSPSGAAEVTLDYACLGCHIDVDDGLTLEAASMFAKNIHTVHAATGCEFDLAGDDGFVGTADLTLLLNSWGPVDEPCPPTIDADFNGDCSVALADLTTLLNNWGPCE